MLYRGLWIVDKIVDVSLCDAQECKVILQFMVDVKSLSMYTEILRLTS